MCAALFMTKMDLEEEPEKVRLITSDSLLSDDVKFKEKDAKPSQQEPPPKHIPKKYNLGLNFLHRFYICLRTLFPKATSKSTALFVLLLVASLGQQYLIYNVGLIPSGFFKVLGSKDRAAFKATIFTAIYFIVGIALANCAVKYISGLLYVKWREVLTSNLHNKYFFQETFYFVSKYDETVDNADQRITQDVDKFCSQLSDISSKLLISPLTIAYYSYKCFSNTSYYGPLCIYAYFVIGSIINRIIMSPIVGLVVKQEQNEGDFRFKHVNIRTSSESVAFLKGARREHEDVNGTFQQLLFIQQRIVNLEFWLNFSVNLFDYLGSILSYFVIAIPIFAGSYDHLSPVQLSALISQNAFVSMYLISCFSTLMDLSSKITDIAGYTHRIGELMESFSGYNDHCKKKTNSFEHSLKDLEDDGKGKTIFYDLVNLSYSADKSKTLLVKNLNLTVMEGKSILVMGATGSGKSSLLRVLRNLWEPENGELKCFIPICPQGIFFLPQEVFLTCGSLFDQVRYPLHFDEKDEMEQEKEKAKVLQCITDVGLTPFLERTENLDRNMDKNWRNVLSPGEMQRLSFARIFYHKPRLAVLDEATSALGEIEEDCFYTYCRQLNITLLSVGHHDSLKKYHDSLLVLKEHGAWEFTELEAKS